MQSFLIGGLAGGFFVFFWGLGVAGIFFGEGYYFIQVSWSLYLYFSIRSNTKFIFYSIFSH